MTDEYENCKKEGIRVDPHAEPDLNFMSLCCKCSHLEDEPGYHVCCLIYPTMSALMFGRKKKCKYFVDLSRYPILEDF